MRYSLSSSEPVSRYKQHNGQPCLAYNGQAWVIEAVVRPQSLLGFIDVMHNAY
jgi:hypothetical protein